MSITHKEVRALRLLAGRAEDAVTDALGGYHAATELVQAVTDATACIDTVFSDTSQERIDDAKKKLRVAVTRTGRDADV